MAVNLLVMLTVLAKPACAENLFGDVNQDGKVNVLDAVFTLRLISKFGQDPTLTQIFLGDVAPAYKDGSFGDGKLNILDAQRLLRRISNLENGNPWPNRGVVLEFPPGISDIELKQVLQSWNAINIGTEEKPFIISLKDAPQPTADPYVYTGVLVDGIDLPELDKVLVGVDSGPKGNGNEQSTSPNSVEGNSEAKSTWGFERVQFPEAFNLVLPNTPYDTSQVVIAFLDSGIDADHPALKDKMLYSEDLTTEPKKGDPIGHGTHVAGIALGSGKPAPGEAVGMMGVCPKCEFISYRILQTLVGSANPLIEVSAIEKAVEWASQNHRRLVINMSYENGRYDTRVERAIKDAIEAGAVIVIAAGNDRTKVKTFPAALADTLKEIISVGASDENDKLWVDKDQPKLGSNYGTWVSVAAPGANIFSSIPIKDSTFSYEDGNNYYRFLSGTSQAAPFVSGLAAMILAINPSLTPSEVKNRILDNADPIKEPDNQSIAKRINIYRSLNAVSSETLEGTSTLTITSDPIGVYVKVGKDDLNKRKNDTTPFERKYLNTTSVDIEAPESFIDQSGQKKSFIRWEVSGKVVPGNPLKPYILNYVANESAEIKAIFSQPLTVAPQPAVKLKEDTPTPINLTYQGMGFGETKFSILGKPNHGELTTTDIASVFTYTPKKDWSGSDQFTYVVSDSSTPPRTASGIISIEVEAVNDPPMVIVPDSFTVTEGQQLGFHVSTNDIDSPLVNLTIDGLPSGAAFDAATGDFIWIPGNTATIQNEYELTFVAHDEDSNVPKVVKITVVPKNSDPITLSIDSVSGKAGSIVIIPIRLNSPTTLGGIRIRITLPSGFNVLGNVSKGELFSGVFDQFDVNIEGNQLEAVLISPNTSKGPGVLFNLPVFVPVDQLAGNYPVNIDLIQAIDFDNQAVSVNKLLPGNISVTTTTDPQGVVTSIDSMSLLQGQIGTLTVRLLNSVSLGGLSISIDLPEGLSPAIPFNYGVGTLFNGQDDIIDYNLDGRRIQLAFVTPNVATGPGTLITIPITANIVGIYSIIATINQAFDANNTLLNSGSQLYGIIEVKQP
jgi:thermitase